MFTHYEVRVVQTLLFRPVMRQAESFLSVIVRPDFLITFFVLLIIFNFYKTLVVDVRIKTTLKAPTYHFFNLRFGADSRTRWLLIIIVPFFSFYP